MIKDQYIHTLPSSEIDPETALQKFLSDDILSETINTHERNITVVVHGPFSELYLKRLREVTLTEFFVETDMTGSPSETEWLQSMENGFQSAELARYLDLQVNTLSPQLGQRYITLKDKLSEISGGRFYGYQPLNLGKLSENIMIDPVVNVSAFLLKFYNEAKEKNLTGRKIMVFHPDLLFYLAGGEKGNITRVADVLNEMGQLLGIEMVFENVYLERDLFRQKFDWAMEPNMLVKLLGSQNNNLGLCIDLEHIIRNAAREGVSPARSLEMARQLLSTRRPIVIHTRYGLGVENPLVREIIMESYKLGIPVVYEK